MFTSSTTFALAVSAVFLALALFRVIGLFVIARSAGKYKKAKAMYEAKVGLMYWLLACVVFPALAVFAVNAGQLLAVN